MSSSSTRLSRKVASSLPSELPGAGVGEPTVSHLLLALTASAAESTSSTSAATGLDSRAIGALVGGLGAGILLCVLVVFTIVWLRRQRRQRERSRVVEEAGLPSDHWQPVMRQRAQSRSTAPRTDARYSTRSTSSSEHQTSADTCTTEPVVADPPDPLPPAPSQPPTAVFSTQGMPPSPDPFRNYRDVSVVDLSTPASDPGGRTSVSHEDRRSKAGSVGSRAGGRKSSVGAAKPTVGIAI